MPKQKPVVVLLHSEPPEDEGWEEKTIEPEKGGRTFGLAEACALIKARRAAVFPLGSNGLCLIMDEEAMLTGRPPSVAVQVRGGQVQAMCGPVIIAKTGKAGTFEGLTPGDIFDAQTGFPWRPVADGFPNGRK